MLMRLKDLNELQKLDQIPKQDQLLSIQRLKDQQLVQYLELLLHILHSII